MDILLVTAHPDDECMFFTPSVRHFKGRGDRLDLLCLSTGNFDGKGHVRRGELEKSAAVLGINSVTIIDDPELLDGPRSLWKSEVILKYVDDLCAKKKYKYIMTFDDYGVSGHVNHCSISKALADRLQSMPIWLKYSGWPGALICAMFFKFFPQNDTISLKISLIEAYYCGHRAMLKHESQMVWFRRLYLIFSIYMTFNVLKRDKRE